MNDERTQDPLDVAHKAAKAARDDATQPTNLPVDVEPVHLTAEWLRGVLTDRNERISELTGAVMASTQEVKSLREDIGARPTREEVSLQRRHSFLRWTAGLVVLMLLTGYTAIWAHEGYRNACSLNPRVEDLPAPSWCSNVFPGVSSAHDHNLSQEGN